MFTWLLLALCILLGVMYWIESINAKKAHNDLMNFYEGRLQEKDLIIGGNYLHIDSLNGAIVIKDSANDSLSSLVTSSKVNNKRHETDFNKGAAVIDTASIRTIKDLLSGQLDSY